MRNETRWTLNLRRFSIPEQTKTQFDGSLCYGRIIRLALSFGCPNPMCLLFLLQFYLLSRWCVWLCTAKTDRADAHCFYVSHIKHHRSLLCSSRIFSDYSFRIFGLFFVSIAPCSVASNSGAAHSIFDLNSRFALRSFGFVFVERIFDRIAGHIQPIQPARRFLFVLWSTEFINRQCQWISSQSAVQMNGNSVFFISNYVHCWRWPATVQNAHNFRIRLSEWKFNVLIYKIETQSLIIYVIFVCRWCFGRSQMNIYHQIYLQTARIIYFPGLGTVRHGTARRPTRLPLQIINFNVHRISFVANTFFEPFNGRHFHFPQREINNCFFCFFFGSLCELSANRRRWHKQN